MLSLVALYATLLLCAAGIGALVYRYDLYDKEPPRPLALAVVLGAASIWIAGRVQGVLIDITVDVAHEAAGNTMWALFAGVSEEVGKIAAVFVVLLVFPRHFNDPLDGLIYGSFAGMGAALEESVFFVGFNDGSPFLPGQEPVRLAGHLIMGGIGGFGLGLRAMRHPRWRLAAAASFAGAALLHTLWDVVAFGAADEYDLRGRVSAWRTAAGVVLMLLGMVAFRWMVSRGAALSKRVFDTRPEAPPGEPA
ncbi:MAG: PrsW family glutamic-type intramembrane protease [Planctomycetota bacterium]|nr:PrsW family glutamic-type intramembrane protease [Planctomycetota bacterium]